MLLNSTIICTLALLAVQVVGLLAMFLARWAQRQGSGWTASLIFLLSLAAVGIGAAFTPLVNPAYTMTAGVTLSIMAIGATIDLGRTPASADF